MGISRIRGPADAKALAARLNGNERARPIALVSTPASSTAPWIDVEVLAAEFGPLVDVYVISTGPDTWSLTNALPTGTQVYGGAGRVYPLGHEWTSDLSRSPLRFAFDNHTGRRATRELVSDGLAMAAAAGLLKARSAQPPTREIGVVKGLPTPDRAIVEMPNRLMATIAQELTIPEVPLDRMLVKGMQVHGLLDTAQRRFDIREAIRPDEAVSYEPGQPVLAVVTEVHADSARFELFPELQVLVGREAITSNENDDLRSLFTVGEVTIVRVRAAGPDWALSLIDIDDDEVPEPAPSIIEGGPPWVTPPPPPEPWAPLADPQVELVEPDTLPLPEPDVPDGVPSPMQTSHLQNPRTRDLGRLRCCWTPSAAAMFRRRQSQVNLRAQLRNARRLSPTWWAHAPAHDSFTTPSRSPSLRRRQPTRSSRPCRPNAT